MKQSDIVEIEMFETLSFCFHIASKENKLKRKLKNINKTYDDVVVEKRCHVRFRNGAHFIKAS